MRTPFLPKTVLRCLLAVAGLMPSGVPVALAAGESFPANEDLRHVRTLSNPALSPDGRFVLLQVAEATADGGRSHLWLLDVALGQFRQLTWSPPNDTAGEYGGSWLGNGDSILFLAKRSERTQLFRLPLSGGEAQPYDLKVVPPVDATRAPDAVVPAAISLPGPKDEPLPLEVGAFVAAPDSRLVAIMARDPETPAEKKLREEKADAVQVNRDPHGTRVYLLDPATGALAAVAVPADVSAIAWAARSDRFIALVDEPNHRSDLGPSTSGWLVEAAKPGQPSRLQGLPATAYGGAWSADGEHFIFHGQSERDAPPGYASLYDITLATGVVRNLTPGFAGSIAGDAPLVQGTGVLQAVQLGTKSTYLRLDGPTRETLAFDVPVVNQMQCATRHAACVWLGESSSEPAALYLADRPGAPARKLPTPALLPAQWPAVQPVIVRWRNEGQALDGLLFLPPEASRQRVPLVVRAHGGPTGAWSESFSPLNAFLLGQGWAVFQPNPRGSAGYGAAFAAANRNDLGGADLRDVMSGMDAVIGGYSIDPDRLAFMGYSYGGELAGVAVGKTTRFKAIVSGAPVIDQFSEYGTEGDSWYDRWFYGKPWEHVADAWRQSPLSTVARAKTPFLLLQGEADGTDPLGQSQEMYRALRQQGVPVEMVSYPREDHGALEGGIEGQPSAEPWHGFDARQRIVAFIAARFAGR